MVNLRPLRHPYLQPEYFSVLESYMGLVGDQIRAACVPYSVHSEYIGRSMHNLVQSCGEGAPLRCGVECGVTEPPSSVGRVHW